MLRRMSKRLLMAALAALAVSTASAQTGGTVSAGTVTSVAGGKTRRQSTGRSAGGPVSYRKEARKAPAPMMFVLTRPGATETQAFSPTSKTKFYVMVDGKAVLASFAEIVLRKTVSAVMQDGQVIQATVLR